MTGKSKTMDLRTTTEVLLRHRRLVALMLALTVLGAVLIGRAVSPVFESKATLLLLAPPAAPDSEGRTMAVNPFSRAGQAERLLSGAAIAVAKTEPFRTEMASRGATGAYSYVLMSEMMLDVQVTAPTAALSLHTLETAVDMFEEQVLQLQADVGTAPESLIKVDTITATPVADELLGSRIRILVAVGLLGLAVTVGTAFAVDATGRRRARLARSRTVGDDEPSSSSLSMIPVPAEPLDDATREAAPATPAASNGSAQTSSGAERP
jgi:hypothetical protein